MTENSVIDAISKPDLDDLAQQMAERLSLLKMAKETVDAAAANVKDAQGRHDTATTDYKEAVKQVREEGLITDGLLEKYGHPVPKKRGRPAVSA